MSVLYMSLSYISFIGACLSIIYLSYNCLSYFCQSYSHLSYILLSYFCQSHICLRAVCLFYIWVLYRPGCLAYIFYIWYITYGLYPVWHINLYLSLIFLHVIFQCVTCLSYICLSNEHICISLSYSLISLPNVINCFCPQVNMIFIS